MEYGGRKGASGACESGAEARAVQTLARLSRRPASAATIWIAQKRANLASERVLLFRLFTLGSSAVARTLWWTRGRSAESVPVRVCSHCAVRIQSWGGFGGGQFGLSGFRSVFIGGALVSSRMGMVARRTRRENYFYERASVERGAMSGVYGVDFYSFRAGGQWFDGK